MTSSSSVAELAERAAALEENGAFTSAMHARERLLLLLQSIHGDPSPQADYQKLMLGKVILKVVGTRDGETQLTRRQGPLAATAAAAAAAGKKSSAGERTPLLTESLSTHGLLAFAERLLSAGNTLCETQRDAEVRAVRARLLLGIGQVLHRQGRPRAALPVVQRALAQLREHAAAAAPEGCTAADLDEADECSAAGLANGGAAQPTSLEIASAHLALCALHSASNHHSEALLEALEALATVVELEERLWRNDPEQQQQEVEVDHREGVAAPQVGRGGDEMPRVADANTSPQQQRATQQQRRKIYYPAFQAACYHNMAAEQEHLGLLSLALESCQTGFELSLLANGPSHPLTVRLRKAYAEVFTSLHYTQFTTSAKKRREMKAVFDSPDAAVAQLNATYLGSLKHREAMAREIAEQDRILHRAHRHRVGEENLSNTQQLLRSKLDHLSATVVGKSHSRGRGGPARPHSASSLTRRPVSAASHRIRPRTLL